MTIRRKLFLTFWGLTVILIGGIAALVVVETQRSGLENFRLNAGGQLTRIDDIFARHAATPSLVHSRLLP